jgi:3-oxochol-4-en-24-oyl-CoA dehydrogenase
MSFTPGEDAEGLRQVVRDFLQKRCPESEVRRIADAANGYDHDVWLQAAQELGLHGLTLPEELGGSGATAVELGVVFEEMGDVLYCAPFFASVGLAATALLHVAGSAGSKYLAEIGSGVTTAALAWAGESPAQSNLSAERSGDGWAITGTASTVIDGADADLVLIAAQTSDGIGLFAAKDPAGIRRTRLSPLDTTRRLAELTFTGAVATRLDDVSETATALSRAFDTATLYLAAEQLGGARRVLADAVEYAGTRVQFGRAIGSFQAIKHRCANMLVDVESARSAVYHGLWTTVHDPEQSVVAATLARAVASDVYQRVAADNIQIHGGIGFTWEHSAHLHLKRAKSGQLLLRAPAVNRRRLGTLLGILDSTGHAVAARASALPDAQDADEVSAEQAVLEAAVVEFLGAISVPEPSDAAGDRAFRQARFDAGLAVVSLPEGSGGRGAAAGLHGVIERRFLDAGAADHVSRNVIGLGMALPTIAAHGTDAQRERFLRPCFTGEEIWCQLFSEPGAGSDLAGVSTRAVRDGDTYIVNGQKIWTSLGHVADFGLLLARTDPDVPKHKGLSYFVLDMRSPGVEVRPLRQLTGEAEFNEVYLTDVRVPARNLLGDSGRGWQVALTTLSNERAFIGGALSRRGEGPIGQAVDLYRNAVATGMDAAEAAVFGERLMQLWTRAEAARLTNVRASADRGSTPGPEGSIAKLQMAELNIAIYELCVDLCGNAGLLIDNYDEIAPTTTAVHGGGDVRKAYLRSLANSIEGGTSEVMRNILGERVLGLPAEPRLDRDIAWKDTRRS